MAKDAVGVPTEFASAVVSSAVAAGVSHYLSAPKKEREKTMQGLRARIFEIAAVDAIAGDRLKSLLTAIESSPPPPPPSAPSAGNYAPEGAAIGSIIGGIVGWASGNTDGGIAIGTAVGGAIGANIPKK